MALRKVGRATGGSRAKREAANALAPRLLAWYDRHRRALPWRAAPGRAPDPYRIWLSEIMLQQTTVPTVARLYERFLARFPSVERLAAAPLDDVLHAWQGLGYYARARNLHRAAQVVVELHGGRLPRDAAALRALPGVGEYTAAAIGAIAFNQPASAVDGNVERVMARMFAVEAPLPSAKRELRRLASGLVPAERAGDYAQALMDLGATLCTPRAPGCLTCPWAEPCEARRRGIAAELPRRAPVKAKPRRFGVVFWLERADGAVLLRRRPNEGLLGGMIEVPSTPWTTVPPGRDEATRHAPLARRWRRVPGEVDHGFTHFDLSLVIMAAQVGLEQAPRGLWSQPSEFHAHAMPTLTKKVVRHARGGA